MRKFRVGDKVKYVGQCYPEYRGKVFTVGETRDVFQEGSPRMKEIPEQGFWDPAVWELCAPRSFINK